MTDPELRDAGPLFAGLGLIRVIDKEVLVAAPTVSAAAEKIRGLLVLLAPGVVDVRAHEPIHRECRTRSTTTGPAGRSGTSSLRILPDPPPADLHAVTQGDRLDRVADDAFGDPEQSWRICDANRALRSRRPRPRDRSPPGHPAVGGLTCRRSTGPSRSRSRRRRRRWSRSSRRSSSTPPSTRPARSVSGWVCRRTPSATGASWPSTCSGRWFRSRSGCKVGPLLPDAIFTGYVTGQEATYSEQPGGTYLRVTAMDATLRMNLQEKVQQWPSMPDSAIAAAIFGQYGVIPKVAADRAGPRRARGDDDPARHGHALPARARPAQRVRLLRRARAGSRARDRPFRAAIAGRSPGGGHLRGHGRRDERRGLRGPARHGPAHRRGRRDPGHPDQGPPAGRGAGLDPGAARPRAEPDPDPPSAHRPTDRHGPHPDRGPPEGEPGDRRPLVVVAVATGKVGPDVGVLRPGGLVNVRGAGPALQRLLVPDAGSSTSSIRPATSRRSRRSGTR